MYNIPHKINVFKSCWWRISTPEIFKEYFKEGKITIKFTTIEPNINLKVYAGMGSDIDSK